MDAAAEAPARKDHEEEEEKQHRGNDDHNDGDWSISDFSEDADDADPDSPAARRGRGGGDSVAGLRAALAHKEALLSRTQQSYESQMADLRRRVHESEQQRAEAERAANEGAAAYEREVRERQTRTQAELQLLRSRLEQMEAHGPGVHKQMSILRDTLRDVTVNEALYLEYKRAPEEQLSLKEFVAVRVYETVQAERAAREALAAELDAARDEAMRSDAEAARLRRELEFSARARETLERDMLEEVRRLEAAGDAATAEVRARGERIEEIEAKADAYDRLNERAARLEAENEELRRRATVDGVTLQGLAEERDSRAARLADLEAAADALRMDKMYLSKEVSSLEERVQSLSGDKDRLRAKVDSLRRARDELVDRLTRVRDEHRDGYEQKLAAELERLQKHTDQSLETIRVGQRDAYEREIAACRDARDAAVAELERDRARLETARSSLDKLAEEHRELRSSYDSTVQKLRNELKIRQFDSQRLALSYEESMAAARRLRLECDKQAKKNEVLRAEYDTLRCESGRTEAELRAETAQLADRVAAYEQLERELDLAIVQSGGVAGGDGGGGGGSSNDLVGALATSLPTAGRRRIRQSIVLAQRLLEKQRELDEALGRLAREQGDAIALRAELDEARRQLDRVAQPHGYLVEQLQAKDAEIREAREVARRLKADADDARARLQASVSDRNRLRRDLEQIVSKSQNVDSVRRMLERMAHGDEKQARGGGGGKGGGRRPAGGLEGDTRAAMGRARPAPAARNVHGASRDGPASPAPLWFKALSGTPRA